MQTGLQLKAWRERQQPELTQDALAAVMGISRWSLSRIENGFRPLKFEEVVRIMQEYQVTIEDIFGLPAPDGVPALPRWLRVLPVLTPAERDELVTLVRRVLQIVRSGLDRL